MTRHLIRDIAFDAWEALVAALAAVVAFETFEPGFAARFFNPNWLVLLAFLAALIGLCAGGAREGRRARRVVLIAGLLIPVAAWSALDTVAFKWRALASVASCLAAALFWRALSDQEKD